MSYAVYILASKRNGTLYIGSTNDIVRRVYEHKNKLAKGFTAQYGVDKLVYVELHEDVRIANQREATMKHWLRKWKIELIEKDNPEWRDLYEEICH